MFNKNLPENLGIRPAMDTDKPFLETLYYSSRDDLRLANAESDFIETLIEQQFQAQQSGYGNTFPNAMYFIVEKHGERIGKVTIDFGSNEIRLIDFALVRAARGKGLGRSIIQILQHAAGQSRAPLVLSVLSTNIPAKKLYYSLGFQLQESDMMYDLMAWYPSSSI